MIELLGLLILAAIIGVGIYLIICYWIVAVAVGAIIILLVGVVKLIGLICRIPGLRAIVLYSPILIFVLLLVHWSESDPHEWSESDPHEKGKRYNSQGMEYYDEGQFEKALQCFKKAEDLLPEEPVCHWNLSLTYAKKGQHALALHECAKALLLDPKNTKFRKFKGLLEQLE